MNPQPLRLLTCEHLEREARAALVACGALDVDVTVLTRRGDAAAGPPEPADAPGSQVLVLGAPGLCGREHGAHQDSCQEALAGRALVAWERAAGSFLVTPGWLRPWPECLEGRPRSAPPGLGDGVTQVVLLDSGVDPESPAQLEALARHVGLPHRTVAVGLDLVSARVAAWVAQARAEQARAEHQEALRAARQAAADYAMAQELLAHMATASTEAEAVDRLLDTAQQLFAPGALAYVPVTPDGLGPPVLRCGPPDLGREARCRAAQAGTFHRTPDGAGFTVAVRHREQVVGVLDVGRVAFPRYVDPYLNTALHLGSTCGLAVAHARTVESLAQEHNRLDVTLRSIGDGVLTTDCAGRVVMINTAAQQLSGWTQEGALGRPVEEVLHLVNESTRKTVENPVAAVLRERRTVELANHTVLVARDGAERVIADSAAPIQDSQGVVLGVVLVFRDSTARHRLESDIQRVARLESLGLLAGGIAHDFNNLLSVVLSGVSLAQDRAGDGDLAAALRDAAVAILRARELTTQLLTFSRGGAPVRRLVNLGAVLREATHLAMSGSNCRAVLDVPPDLWAARVDGGQIAQVVQNLVLNATQAMPAGGVVHVAATNLAAPERLEVPLAPGAYVQVSVTDAGPGIAPEHLPRIFDPFFTTKPTGTGLGLSVAHSIVHRHDGYLGVRARPGQGATFFFCLPADAVEAPEATVARLPRAVRGSRVLVMDDDPLVLRSAGRVLTHLGCTVEGVREGAEALRAYSRAQARGTPFHAVLLDLTVRGGMGGAETLARLREVDPAVRAVCFSGYANADVMAEYQAHGFLAALPKPFSPEELLEVLEPVVGGLPETV